MATQDEVKALHLAEPRLTAAEIAKRLECKSGYVRATARRLRITLPVTRGVQALGEAAKAAGMTIADIDVWALQNTIRAPRK